MCFGGDAAPTGGGPDSSSDRGADDDDVGARKAREERLMREWFELVNKKNELLRRDIQLRIREREADLQRHYNKCNEELQCFHGISAVRSKSS